ncbi:MAG: phosphatidylserine/phosphatidylglycerophosphate/cardiolipin synthase family protein [Myxococcales bacterium]|nr:phosphatidylserine/phosphatidylglycerophosphate/cardiolipin synthase family protein [Myxococcales bacterium]MCB9524767.1 phosphatidylserine/phosphatidylglycerophosphate/cardiolipin synthase family protein [Myxococcales bacterium]
MSRTATLLAALALLLGACDTSDPRPEAFGGDTAPVHTETDYFEKFEAIIVSPEGTGITAAALEQRAVSLVAEAEGEIVAAFARLESTAIAEALVAAKDRGLSVFIAADTDARGDAGFAVLRDGGVPVVFGNGPITWSPQPGMNVRRLGSQNRMTHTMIIADGLRLLAVTGGFFDPTDEAAVASRWQVGFAAVGQIFCKDFRHTLRQLVAGTFATTLTLFGASTSADGNNRTVYPIEDGVVEAYYGPQEPLAKHMIDEIYRARSSVWIASQTFANEALVDALRYKVRAGFDVRVLVPTSARGEGYTFDDYTERVGLVQALETALAADGVEGVIREKAAPMGTVVILDAIRSPINGSKYAGQALISSQPLSSTIAFGPTELRDGSLPGRPSDVFTDGHMVVLRENNANPGTGDFPAAVAWFEALWEVE